MKTNNFTKRAITIAIDGKSFTVEELRCKKEQIENVFTSSFGKTFVGIYIDNRGAKAENPLTLINVVDYVDIDHLGFVSLRKMKEWEKGIRTVLMIEDSVDVDIVFDYEQYNEAEGQNLIEQFISQNGGWLSRKYNV